MIEYVRGKGVMSICYWIVGLPGETRELMAESYAYAKTLSTDWIVFSKAIPLVGTEIFNQYVEKGLFPGRRRDPVTGNSFYLRSFDTEEISAYDLSDLVCRMSYEYNFVHNVSLKDGTFQRAVDIYSTFLGKDPEQRVRPVLHGQGQGRAGPGGRGPRRSWPGRKNWSRPRTRAGSISRSTATCSRTWDWNGSRRCTPIPNPLFRNPPY